MSNGRDTEQLAADAYQAAGYTTYIPPKAKYREQDVFGLFDILAFGHGRLDCIQVKGGRKAAGINDWFVQATAFWTNLEDVRVTFMHRKQDSWRVARCAPDGYEWVFDGRTERDGGPASVEAVIK